VNQDDLNDIAHRIASAALEFAPGYRPTTRQKADAAAILRDMIQATEIHGVRFEHFDGIANFPRLAIQLVQYRDESR
jgi:hypothetical protein